MRAPLLVVISLLAVFTSGCESLVHLNGHIESLPDPYYQFDRSSAVLVMAVPSGSNVFQSRAYVSSVADALRTNGFPNVIEEQRVRESRISPEMIVVVSVEKETTSYQYTQPVYGTKQVGSTTNCSEVFKNTTCTTTPTNLYGVKIGEEVKTGNSLAHTLRLTWYDAQTKATVFSTVTSSTNSGCTDEAMYAFLVEQSLRRMKFGGAMNENFSVEMPKGYQCR